MRHRFSGRKLGRNASHRKAMFRNMACSLICSVRVDEDDDSPGKQKVPGRIITTVAKAKELRPIVEKLITLARRAKSHEEKAAGLGTSAKRNSSEWEAWRKSDKWNKWNQAIAPAVAMRRRAFAALRDNLAVDILFDELASRFEGRPGGYTRVVRLGTVRLGDAGPQALIEFVGERDRIKSKRKAPSVTADDESPKPKKEAAKGQKAAKKSEEAESKE